MSSIQVIEPELSKLLRTAKWNFDLEDSEHIFRVENCSIDSREIIDLFQQYGFTCEELV